jgi:hypothetical protein
MDSGRLLLIVAPSSVFNCQSVLTSVMVGAALTLLSKLQADTMASPSKTMTSCAANEDRIFLTITLLLWVFLLLL